MKHRISAGILAAVFALSSTGCTALDAFQSTGPEKTVKVESVGGENTEDAQDLGDLNLNKRDYFRCYKPAIEQIQAKYADDAAALKVMKYTLYDLDGDDNYELIVDVDTDESSHGVWVYSSRGGKPLELPYSTFEDQKISATESPDGYSVLGEEAASEEDSGESSETSSESGEESAESTGTGEFSTQGITFYDSPTGLIFARDNAVYQLFVKNGCFGENSLTADDAGTKIEDFAPRDVQWYEAGCVDGLVDMSHMETVEYEVKSLSKYADENNKNDNLCLVEYPVLKGKKYKAINKDVKNELKALFSENRHFGESSGGAGANEGPGGRSSYFKATVAAVSELDESLSIVIGIDQMTDEGVFFTLRGYNYSTKDGSRLSNEAFYSDAGVDEDSNSLYCVFRSFYYESGSDGGLYVSKMVLDGEKVYEEYMKGDSDKSSSDSSSDSDSSTSYDNEDYSRSESSDSLSDSESSGGGESSSSGGSDQSDSGEADKSESSGGGSDDSGGSDADESSSDDGGGDSGGGSDDGGDASEDGE